MNKLHLEIQNADSEVASLLLERVKNRPNAIAMHYGSPSYDPISDPQFNHYLGNLFNQEAFCDGIKKYEQSRGSLTLRKTIAEFYWEKYHITIDPYSEIIITNGSVEAFVLAIMSTTKINDAVAVTNPTYPLFSKTLTALGRKIISIIREPSQNEYQFAIENNNFLNCKCLVINSPENPTGYVLSKQDWSIISKKANEENIFIIHDETLGALDFESRHFPVHGIDELKNYSITINGFSKMFGLPGIKIGWMIANEDIINTAIKQHDYLYLGVNSFSEHIADSILGCKEIHNWLIKWNTELKKRRNFACQALSINHGFEWPRYPYGGLSLTPKVNALYDRLPKKYKKVYSSVGMAVAEYLFNENEVSVTPGEVYGSQLNEYIKIVTCNDEKDFYNGVNRLKCNF